MIAELEESGESEEVMKQKLAEIESASQMYP